MNDPATVSDFALDTHEVTVARFSQFVEAGGGTQQNPPSPGAGARTLNDCASRRTWTDQPGINEDLPILHHLVRGDGVFLTRPTRC